MPLEQFGQQVVNHHGLFVCWGPENIQQTFAAMNIVARLVQIAQKAIIGELSRPVGVLYQFVPVDAEVLSRSLVTAANAHKRIVTEPDVDILHFMEDTLVTAIPLDPRKEESPEMHFFLNCSPENPEALFNPDCEALKPDVSAFIPDLLQTLRRRWDFSLIQVGFNPVDRLHWEAFKACDRLLLFLSPDPSAWAAVAQWLPKLANKSKITPANIDVIVTEADRGWYESSLEPVLESLRKHPEKWQENNWREAERRLRKVAGNDPCEQGVEEVRGFLKPYELHENIIGALPDALSLIRMNRKRIPVVMDPRLLHSRYAEAICDITGAWVSPPAGKK